MLDLFCGAGGAAMGYNRAGFEVVGVDIAPQPRYPFELYRADALDLLPLVADEFDAIHSSPPCQRYSKTQQIRNREHPDLIGPTREAAQADRQAMGDRERSRGTTRESDHAVRCNVQATDLSSPVVRVQRHPD